jgi:predicted short-subunit dehydrogenase-like oxidoreductase (DUF2520 family)
LDIILAGPGRAGTAVCLAAAAAGHAVNGVVGRSSDSVERAADRFGAPAFDFGDDLPTADLLVIAVHDDAISQVAASMAPHTAGVDAAIHLSGLTSVSTLSPLASVGLKVGVLHPLQTLPTPDVGAAALPGSWMAVTADEPAFRGELEAFARSLGARPFVLSDDRKAVYHAAASVAANATVAVLDVASALFEAAKVPFEAARPLVDAVVDNAFRLGPSVSLTGPIVRGDVGTVAAQIRAIAEHAPGESDRFRLLCQVIADLAGTGDLFEDLR